MYPTGPVPGVGLHPVNWGNLVLLPEILSAARALRRVEKALTHRPKRQRLPNPIFLHGPPGTGKSLSATTLVESVLAQCPTVTAEILASQEFRAPIADDTGLVQEFDDRESLDLLVLEDLQHLSPKSANALARLLDTRAAHKRPTVLTSTLSPAGLTDLPRRLTSRFGAGLVIRIDPPDSQSRRTLAEIFTERDRLNLTPDALDYLAGHAVSTRALVGMVARLVASEPALLPVYDLATVSQILHDPDLPGDTKPRMDRILDRVASGFGVKPKDVLGPGRQKSILNARQVAMYLARETGGFTLPRIGEFFGGRDHTTVLHSVRKIEQAMHEDAKLKRMIRELRRELG